MRTAPIDGTDAEPRDLGDGYVLRDAGPGDVSAIIDLLDDRMDEEVAAEGVAAIDEFGLEGWVVVTHDGVPVSCSALLAESWELAGTTLAVGMPDFIATRSAQEGRGLVRAQIELHHARSYDRGDAIQSIIGIPYYYRRFGYSYPLATQHDLAVREPWPRPVEGVTVRAATLDELPVLEALQTRMLAAADLRMRHSTGTWRCLFAIDHMLVVVAERDGDIVGTARLYHDEDTVHILDLAGDRDGIDAIVEYARHGATDVRVQHRPAPEVMARLRQAPTRSHAAVFVRVPDLVRILDVLAPVLSERLGAAQLRGVPTSFTISRYTDAAVLEIRDRTIVDVRPTAPIRYGTPGVLRCPPDDLPALLFGPHGARRMEESHPDVLLGDVRDLAATLFPPITADLLTWVPPY